MIYDNSTESNLSGADKIVVLECDEFIEKYEACVTGKVPPAAHATMLSSIEQMRQRGKPLPNSRRLQTNSNSGTKNLAS